MTLDDDLERLTREELASEVAKLRRGIREHRDSSGQELCWHHPALWGLLPEKAPIRFRRAGLARVHAGVRFI